MCIITINEKFARKCDEIEASGETKLLDAIDMGIRKLLDWKSGDAQTCCNKETIAKRKEKRKNAKLRIITLTDGLDNGSHITTYALAKKLIENNIVVDSVCIGDSANNYDLRGVCRCVGGYTFVPEPFHEGLRIFECETFSTQALRPEYNRHKILDVNDLTHDTLEKLKYTPVYECSDVNVPKSKQNE